MGIVRCRRVDLYRTPNTEVGLVVVAILCQLSFLPSGAEARSQYLPSNEQALRLSGCSFQCLSTTNAWSVR